MHSQLPRFLLYFKNLGGRVYSVIKKVGAVHNFAFIFETPEPNQEAV